MRGRQLVSDSRQRRWKVGITDHVVPPADIERQAFPEVDFHFLGDWKADASATAMVTGRRCAMAQGQS